MSADLSFSSRVLDRLGIYPPLALGYLGLLVFMIGDGVESGFLSPYLRERGLTRIVCVGLAFDYCVRYSAEDAVAHGFDTIVIEEACRAIDLAGSAAATKASFRDRGIKLK